MRRIMLIVAYDGTKYCGWQIQPNAITVEEVLNRELSRLLKEEIMVIGASRTDSGVHANEYLAVVEEHGSASIPESAVARAMNTYLPKDISVFQSVAVADDFKIRHEVEGKEYVYLIWNGASRNPFLSDRALYYPRKLDINAMRKAIPCFIGKHDFRAFMASGSDIADTVRTITDLRVEAEGESVKIYVSADGFLYNMVRIIVGTLLEISEGKISAERLEKAIETGERALAGRTAPAEGLYLNRVFLNPEIWKREEESRE